MNVTCAHCGSPIDKPAAYVNRAQKLGKPMFCNKTCFGLSRRAGKTAEQKKEEKRLYDMKYRAKNLQSIKEKKAAHFKATYDPERAAEQRKKRMPQHIEYCRRPEYKAKKSVYDAQYRAKKMYGEFHEAFLLLLQIDREVEARASKYEIGLANGTINKAQTRRRNYERSHSNES
jgi:hypothetical protein